MITSIAERERASARAPWQEAGSGPMCLGSPSAPAHQDQVLDFIFRIQQLTSRSQIEAELADELARYDIAYFLISDRNRGKPGNILASRVHPEAFDHYMSENYLAIDPVIEAAEHSVSPVIWSRALTRRGLSLRQKQIFVELRDFGLRDGMCMSLSAPSHNTALAACGGADPHFNARTRTSVQAILIFTYNRLVHLEQAEKLAGTKITQREADCLTWVACGKTDWEIGEILKISENTAHWYIERAKRKLGVATRIQAVVSAIQNGIIDI